MSQQVQGARNQALAACLRDVHKNFGANPVLKGVSMEIPPGDLRALVGRNGAGKSTAVAMLTGLLTPDSGEVFLDGEPSPSAGDRAAWRRAVACVYQKFTLVPALSVAENLFLNDFGKSSIVSWPTLRKRAESELAAWGLDIDVRQEAGRLTVEQKQIVEIARALSQGSRFIILDEPTAELEARGVQRLFDHMTRLSASGVTFLYISHHLEEIHEICRSVTVMRDGLVVAESALSSISPGEIVEAMVGQAVNASSRQPLEATRGGQPCLDVEQVLITGECENVSLSVQPGECVGLTGLVGSGKESVAEAIVGLRRPNAGHIRVAGEEIQYGDVAGICRAGVGYVPRDRRGKGLLPQLSIAENLTATIGDKITRAGFIRADERDSRATSMVKDLQLVASSLEQPIIELSGGNQQKGVMGRALISDPKVLVLVHPTQGVDIASKEALFDRIALAENEGIGVLIVSDDLDELKICNRVLVIFKGRIAAEFGRDRSDHSIVAAMEGV